MSAQHEFYLARAAEARAGALAATLDNVRNRWLTSEASWTEMADRSARCETQRKANLSLKEAARVLEQATLSTT